MTFKNINCDYCGKKFEKPTLLIAANNRRSAKNYCSKEHKHKAHGEKMLGKNNPNYGNHKLAGKNHPMYGKKHSPETRKKISLNLPDRSGKNSPTWKGGITSKNTKERLSYKNIQFIKNILKRDNYTCQICDDNKDGNLVVDHIMPWSLYLKLRHDPENTRTLCRPCHKKYGANPNCKPPRYAISSIMREGA